MYLDYCIFYIFSNNSDCHRCIRVRSDINVFSDRAFGSMHFYKFLSQCVKCIIIFLEPCKMSTNEFIRKSNLIDFIRKVIFTTSSHSLPLIRLITPYQSVDDSISRRGGKPRWSLTKSAGQKINEHGRDSSDRRARQFHVFVPPFITTHEHDLVLSTLQRNRPKLLQVSIVSSIQR